MNKIKIQILSQPKINNHSQAIKLIKNKAKSKTKYQTNNKKSRRKSHRRKSRKIQPNKSQKKKFKRWRRDLSVFSLEKGLFI